MKQSFTEKRRIRRFSIALPAHIKPKAHCRPSASTKLISRDVSANGAFFLTSYPIAVGTQVEVTMKLQALDMWAATTGSAHVVVSGKILRNDNSGMAVCFDKNYSLVPSKDK